MRQRNVKLDNYISGLKNVTSLFVNVEQLVLITSTTLTVEASEDGPRRSEVQDRDDNIKT